MNITIQNLSKSYGGHDIFNDFSLDIVDGMRLCVCGPNGTGKSTLLRMLAGVTAPDGGRVIIPRECRVGYVEQILDEEIQVQKDVFSVMGMLEAITTNTPK